MKKYVAFEKKRCTNLVLKISPHTSFQDILSRMEKIEFVGCSISSEHIIYSVLELVNNSLRAQRSRKVDDPILLNITAESHGFEIELKDWGGGFDVNSLPYSLEGDIGEVNIHSEDFENYRQFHNYRRFGLGLYLARKTFHDFAIHFFDSEGNDTEWVKGNSVGTRIKLRALNARDSISDRRGDI